MCDEGKLSTLRHRHERSLSTPRSQLHGTIKQLPFFRSKYLSLPVFVQWSGGPWRPSVMPGTAGSNQPCVAQTSHEQLTERLVGAPWALQWCNGEGIKPLCPAAALAVEG